jgi:ribosomal protein S18 acetylase RimI-like enzyme
VNADVQFRRFRGSDAPAVRELHEVALRHAGAFAESAAARTWDRDLHDIHALYLQSGGEFLVGVSGGRIVAMGGLRVGRDARGQIRRLRVHPDHQGHGIGRALLARLEARAFAMGLTTLVLDTSPAQVAARRLFASAGYVETHRSRRGGLEMIFMEKTLDASTTYG